MWPRRLANIHPFFRLIYVALAAVGAAAVFGMAIVAVDDDPRDGMGGWLYRWLAGRHPDAGLDGEEDVTKRVTALPLDQLSRPQLAVSKWLSRKYRVAPEPIAALVVESYALAKTTGLPAHLILAVASIESNFHPYIQSDVGAQGLMQVMPKVHEKRYEAYGGKLSAFDPITNLRVGTAVLVDCIKLRNGSVDEGLKFYFGGGTSPSAELYVAKVRTEMQRLDMVASGRRMPAAPETAAEGDPS